jgi:cellulose synthase/poly-beta-1,6-N-acetylglucosamine synthase-like glycosyltransferase
MWVSAPKPFYWLKKRGLVRWGMPFEKKSFGIIGFFKLLMVFGIFAFIFLLVFFNSEYSKIYYILVAAIGLYVAVFYVLTNREQPVVAVPKPKKFPSLTVLIPSYNSAFTLKNCLEAVLKMRYPRSFKVMVVDDCSTDDTATVLKKFPQVKVLRHEKNMGKAKGLNKAIRMVKSELVVCVDSDTYPNPRVLLDCIPRFYARPNVGAVAPFITVANAKSFVQRMQEIEYYSGFGFYSKVASRLDGLYVAPGPLTVFKRSALVESGGFDEDNLTEDMEIALRLHDHGYAIEYSPSQVPTEVPTSLKGLYKQRLRWYRGTIFNILKYKKIFFNPKFNVFGKFFFPALAVFVATILLSFVVIWAVILFGVVQWFSKLYLSISISHIPLTSILLENFTFSSLWLFVGLAVVVWYVFFVESISMLGIKKSSRMILPALATIFVYPLIISIVYIVSLFKELKASKRTW